MEPAVIEVHNATARLTTTPNVLAQVRKLVAYQDMVLPSIEAQRIIRGFMNRPLNEQEAAKRDMGLDYLKAPRYGDDLDLQLLYQWHGQQLDRLGWHRARLEGRVFKDLMRLRGMWDGWNSLVSMKGTFGAGLVPHVRRALELRLGVPVEVRDSRAVPQLQGRYRPAKHPSLFAFQSEAVEAWLAAGGLGVVDLPPRSGKTHIAIEVVCRLGLPTLIIVPRKILVTQTVKRFREWFPADLVQGVTGGAASMSAKKRRVLNRALIWVATPGTAAGKKGPDGERMGMPAIQSRQVLIIDEFHHSAAKTYQQISRAACNAYYRLGLTGTHYRADGKDMLMHAILSRAVYKRSIVEMVKLGRLVPAKVAMVRIPGYTEPNPGERLYGVAVVNHEERNQMLSWAALKLIAMGKRVLVLVKEVAHARKLAKLIPGALQVDGADNSQVRPALDALEAREVSCVVGTSVIGEGVDVPAADALVYAAGGKSKVKVVQDFFRVLTASSDKAHGLVIDCADNHNDKLIESAAQRLALFRDCFDSSVVNWQDLGAWLDAQ